MQAVLLLIIPFNFHSLYIGKCKFATGGHTAQAEPPPTTTDAAEIPIYDNIAYGKSQHCPTNACTSTDGAELSVCDNIAYAGNIHTHEHTTDPEYERLDCLL